MQEALPLNLFTEKTELFLNDLVPENCFELLGHNLEQWINKILLSHDVGDLPVLRGQASPMAYINGPVFLHESAQIEAGAYVQGPCYIGPGSVIRHAAYIRGNVYVGKNCIVGHTTEVKNSVFFDEAKAGHFAYIGDSILFRNVNLGAGTKLANLKLNRKEVAVLNPSTDKKLGTGLKKMGAILGDAAQTGCNAVLSPGSLLLPNTMVGPCKHFHGTLKPS